MITIHFMLITTRGDSEAFESSMNAVPHVHDMLSLGGNLYRVEDVTHIVESQEVHVRAVR
jgi:hypothetical protein